MRFEPSYMARLDADMRVNDWLRLPKGLDVRPVVGVRWLDLNLLSRDGLQVYPADPGGQRTPCQGTISGSARSIGNTFRARASPMT